MRRINQRKYMSVWVGLFFLCSCQYMEHKINQIWGQDERPVVDKEPYKARRAPVGNPKNVLGGMPSMPSSSPSPMATEPAGMSGSPAMPSLPAQGGMSGYVPSSSVPSAPNMSVEDVYAPINTMSNMGTQAVQNDPIAGESLREMSKEFEDIKGGKFTFSPYAKYKEVYTTFEPMASEWVVTEEQAVEEFVEKDNTVIVPATPDKQIRRKQSMFPLNDYAPSATRQPGTAADNIPITKEDRPENKEALVGVPQPASTSFEVSSPEGAPAVSSDSQDSSVDMSVHLSPDIEDTTPSTTNRSVSYKVTVGQDKQQEVVDDYGAKMPARPQVAKGRKSAQ